MDYPGFESLDAPDMETYSKAVNAGQFPLSVLALSDYVANVYQPSLYGNTMTANPRALEVGCATLALVTDELSENIQQRGKEFITKLMELQSRTDDAITAVNGTGLLVAAELNSDVYNVVGERSVERYMHQHGVNVIHGGRNALRFTPSFTITSNEIDLITGVTEQALRACK